MLNLLIVEDVVKRDGCEGIVWIEEVLAEKFLK